MGIGDKMIIVGKVPPASKLTALEGEAALTASVSLVFDEFEGFHSRGMQRLRRGTVPESSWSETPVGGKAKWDASCWAQRSDLEEILLSCQFRRSRYGVHQAHAAAVEKWVRNWTMADHEELAGHLRAVSGKPLDESEQRELERKSRETAARLAAEAAEKDRLAREQRERVERERRAREAEARRAEETRELEEAIAFQLQVSAGAGAW